MECRGSHKPSSDFWTVLGSEGVFDKGYIVHGGSVLGGHMWSWVG